MTAEGSGAARGINVALAFCLPLSVWLLAQSLLVSDRQADPLMSFTLLLQALFLLQVVAVTLALPAFLRAPTRRTHAEALGMVLLAPLPLYSLCWLTGSATAAMLLRTLATAAGLSLLLYAVFSVAVRLAPAGRIRALTCLSLQAALIAATWRYRDVLMSAVGL